MKIVIQHDVEVARQQENTSVATINDLSDQDLRNLIQQFNTLTKNHIDPTADNRISQLEEAVNILIKGSANKALAINTFIFWTAFASGVAMSPFVNSMPNLPGELKSLLVAAPLFSAPLQIKVGKDVDKTGGQSTLLKLRIIGLAGLTSLTIIASIIDPETVFEFDARYAWMLGSAIAAGASIQIFPLMTSLVHWKVERAGHMTAVYAGVGGSALAISALTLQYILDNFGLAPAIGLFLGISTLGTVVTKTSLYPSPYHQLLESNFTEKEAELLARRYGQKAFPSSPDDFAKTLFHVANDRRTIVLAIAISATFGGFISSSTSLFLALINVLKLLPSEAITFSAIGSLWSTFIRTISGDAMDRYDSSGGAYSIILSSILSMVGALMLALPESVGSLYYVGAAVFLMYTGFGIGATATFRTTTTWSKNSTQSLQPMNLGTLNSLVGVVGASCGAIFPMIARGLATVDAGPPNYLRSFWFTGGLSAAAGVSTAVIHRYLTNNSNHSNQDITPSVTSPHSYAFSLQRAPRGSTSPSQNESLHASIAPKL